MRQLLALLVVGSVGASILKSKLEPNRFTDYGGGLGLFACNRMTQRILPKIGDSVTVHYTGRLITDNVQFDSSRDRGQPFTFTIGEGEVIDGWDEGLMKLALGERAILQVPAAKGYGSAGSGDIPPNADLYFDVEMLAINGKKPTEKAKKLPEDGYSGKKVRHEDGETCTDDWLDEYGHGYHKTEGCPDGCEECHGNNADGDRMSCTKCKPSYDKEWEHDRYVCQAKETTAPPKKKSGSIRLAAPMAAALALIAMLQ